MAVKGIGTASRVTALGTDALSVELSLFLNGDDPHYYKVEYRPTDDDDDDDRIPGVSYVKESTLKTYRIGSDRSKRHFVVGNLTRGTSYDIKVTPTVVDSNGETETGYARTLTGTTYANTQITRITNLQGVTTYPTPDGAIFTFERYNAPAALTSDPSVMLLREIHQEDHELNPPHVEDPVVSGIWLIDRVAALTSTSSLTMFARPGLTSGSWYRFKTLVHGQAIVSGGGRTIYVSKMSTPYMVKPGPSYQGVGLTLAGRDDGLWATWDYGQLPDDIILTGFEFIARRTDSVAGSPDLSNWSTAVQTTDPDAEGFLVTRAATGNRIQNFFRSTLRIRTLYKTSPTGSVERGIWSPYAYGTAFPGVEDFKAIIPTEARDHATLTWNDPTATPISPPTAFEVGARIISSTPVGPWVSIDVPSDASSTSNSYTVKNLDPDEEYQFRVALKKDGDVGPYSLSSPTGRVRDLETAVGDQSVTITWKRPESDGGSPHTHFLTQMKGPSDTQWTDQRTVTVSQGDTEDTEYSVTYSSLTNGTTYSFRVRAVTASENGPWEEVEGLAATTPSVPLSFSGVARDRAVVLSWAAPSSTGGSPLLAYLIQGREKNEANPEDWTLLSTFTGVDDELTYTQTPLVNNTEYEFRIGAVNAATDKLAAGGYDPDDVTFTTLIALTPANRVPPSAIADLQATAGTNKNVTFSWTPPDAGTSAITKYQLQYSVKPADTASYQWTTVDIALSDLTDVPGDTSGLKKQYTFSSGLSASTIYSFRIAAISDHVETGSEAWSATVEILIVSPPEQMTITVESGDAALTVNWESVANGGKPITGYHLQVRVSGATNTDWADVPSITISDPDLRTHTLTGLQNGQQYDVRMRAVNANGNGEWSAVVSKSPAAPLSVPSVPRDFVGQVKNQAVDLSWTEPADNGNTAITGYVVRVKLETSSTWTTYSSLITTKTYEQTSLVNNTAYDFQVCAVNSQTNYEATTKDWVADAVWTESITLTPRVVTPGKPIGVVGIVGDQSLTIEWSAPRSTGGFDITSYTVQYRVLTNGNPGSWTSVSVSPPSAGAAVPTKTVIGSLTNGSEYHVQVAAANSRGLGPYQPFLSLRDENNGETHTKIVPSAGTVGRFTLFATADNRSVELTWVDPITSPPAIEIIKLEFGYKLATATDWSTVEQDVSTTTITKHAIASLTAGTAYDFRMRGHSSAGAGAWSEIVSQTPYALPAAVSNVQATPKDGQAVITWDALVDTGVKDTSPTGSSALTAYQVQYRNDLAGGSTFVSAPDITATENGAIVTTTTLTLNNETTYSIRVRGRNIHGYGAFPTSGTLTTVQPAKTPEAINSLQVAKSFTPTTVTLTWPAPSAPVSAPITGYDIRYNTADSADTTQWTQWPHSGTALTATITGLTTGQQYFFRIAAINRIGTGAYTGSITVTPQRLPDAITVFEAVPRVGSVFLTWAAPADLAGHTVSKYIVEWALTLPAVDWTTANTVEVTLASGQLRTSTTVPSLTNGTSYSFRIRLETSGGFNNPWSDVVTASPGQAPERITDLTVQGGDTEAHLNWSEPETYGSPVSKYHVRMRQSATGSTPASPWERVPYSRLATTLTVKSLTNNVAYDFTVRTRTAFFAPARWSNRVTTTPMGNPAKPKNLKASVGNGRVTLYWRAPTTTQPITNYRVQYRTSAITGANAAAAGRWLLVSDRSPSPLASQEISSLANGTAYDFRVRTVTGTGDDRRLSSWRRVQGVIPGIPPLSVTGISVSVTATRANVTWSPAISALPILNYELQYISREADPPSWVLLKRRQRRPTSDTNEVLTNLKQNIVYDLRIAAINAAGRGPYTEFLSGIQLAALPRNAPGAPTNFTAETKNRGVTLSWEAAPVRGGSDIARYAFQYREASPRTAWTKQFRAATTGTMTREIGSLTNGKEYEFQIQAENAGGVKGPWTKLLVAIPTGGAKYDAIKGTAQEMYSILEFLSHISLLQAWYDAGNITRPLTHHNVYKKGEEYYLPWAVITAAFSDIGLDAIEVVEEQVQHYNPDFTTFREDVLLANYPLSGANFTTGMTDVFDRHGQTKALSWQEFA